MLFAIGLGWSGGLAFKIRCFFGKLKRHIQSFHKFFHDNRLGEVTEETNLDTQFNVAQHGVGTNGNNRNMRGRWIFAQDFQGIDPADTR